jgi:hypothetical protein
LAPNEGIEIKATGSVHLSLQGERLGASILAQHLNYKALAVPLHRLGPVPKHHPSTRASRLIGQYDSRVPGATHRAVGKLVRQGWLYQERR